MTEKIKRRRQYTVKCFILSADELKAIVVY